MTSSTLEHLDFSSTKSADWAAEVFDEAFDADRQPRAHWSQLIAELGELSPEELNRRAFQAEQTLHENGITFNVFGGEGGQRPWTLDLLPFVFDREQWLWLSGALQQRARLLEHLIRDIYGPQELLRSGLLPPEVVFPQPRYLRQFIGLHSSERTSLSLYATELARAPDGLWYAMADRTDAPVGLGFVLENRIVTARLMPQLVHQLRIERLASFFIEMKNALVRLCPNRKERPRVVLLTPGPHHRFYFEDVYLARYLGYTLAEGGDLAVRDDKVFLKTLSGLQPVDVIYSRTMEGGLDPLELGDMANSGVPGLLQAVREGHVQIMNTPGCGLLEAPVFMAFLPQLCREIFGEDLLLPSIPTWWCGDPGALETVWARFDELVIKPAFRSSGQEEFIVSRLTAEQVAELRERIIRKPGDFVAQERISRSAVPCWRDQQIRPGHAALRTFCVRGTEDSFHLLPGGLVRLAPTPEPMELSVLAGSSSKDLWIPAEGPVKQVTLLDAEDAPVTLKRSDALFPSRVADNLFWLGQSLERADFLARVLRATAERMTSESDQDQPELPGLLRVLADQGQIEPGFAVDEFHRSLPEIEQILPRVIFDAQEAKGLGKTVSELRRLNGTVRDWISADMWRMIQQGVERFFDSDSETDDLAELLTTVDQLLLDIAAVSGLIQDGMIRGPAWLFLDIGRRIDRGRNTANLLISALSADQLGQKAMLKALLEILDCRMTYRSRYLENIQQNGVLDLAITDETCPHSIAFQAVQLAQHIEGMPQERHPLRSGEKRTIMKIVHAVRMLTGDQLEESPPRRLGTTLNQIESQFKTLSDELTRKYLVLSVRPRQIHE